MHILLATDADWVVDEVTAALGDNETSFTVCREGRLVSELVAIGNIDVVIADLQIGSMGGMAVAMDLRLDASSGAVPETPLVMLLDRDADVFWPNAPELRRGSSSHSTPCGCVERSLQQLREIRTPRACR